jgi:adenylate kinase
MLSEYEMHMNDVRASFSQFIYDYECVDLQDTMEAFRELTGMLRLRYKSDAPRRPPRVIILGPPGSSRSTQTRLLCKKYGLVSVSPEELLKEEAQKSPGIQLKVKEALDRGQPVPDDLILRLVDTRIRQTDCAVNGWVLDGFPESEA